MRRALSPVCHPERSEGSQSFNAPRFFTSLRMTGFASAVAPRMEDIRDIKGLVPLPHSWWWLGALLGVVVIGAIAVWLWKQKRTTTAPNAVGAPLSPFDIAVAALRRLREQDPPVEEFYTRLSDIVRQYLEGQFGLRAPKRTTEEFLYEMSRDHALSPEHKNLLGTFLQESDLVKFARFRPGEEDKRRALGAAERFVHDTQPRAAEAVAAS